MAKWAFGFIFLVSTSFVWAENNTSSMPTDNNTSIKQTDNKQLQKHLKEQMKLEEKYSKTQAFEMGDDYNLSQHMVDPNDLNSITVPEPMYDFDMDDVYD